MSLTDLTLAVFLGGMLQAAGVSAINYGLRKYHARKAVKKLEQALTELAALRYAQGLGSVPREPPEGLN